MTEHVDELVKELKRRNLEKKKALSRGEKRVKKRAHRPRFLKIRRTGGHAGAIPTRHVGLKEHTDLHEVALRVRGKK